MSQTLYPSFCFFKKMTQIYFFLWYTFTWCIKHAEELSLTKCRIIVKCEGSGSQVRPMSCTRVKVTCKVNVTYGQGYIRTNSRSCEGQCHM